MRPEILYPLFKPVDSLKGVGPRLKPALERLAGPHVVDLLWHLPSGAVDRRHQCPVNQAHHGLLCTLTVRVLQHLKPPTRSRPYRVLCEDQSGPSGGSLVLTFFHAHADYLGKTLPEGELRVVSGTIEDYNGELQMTHPEHIVRVADIATVLTLEPTYPLTYTVSQKVLTKAIRKALDQTTALAEWHDPALLGKHGWQTWFESLHRAHHPDDLTDLEAQAPARQRLAYDELLANQLALRLVRRALRRSKGLAIRGDGRLRARAMDSLAFTLTGSQTTALGEIIADMESDLRMLRLLQGDVGSGKTVVAFLAMLAAVEAGSQAVLMAPTEILARQHLATIAPLAAAAGLNVAILTGREKGKTRAAILEDLKSGHTHIAIGTHALFQDGVAFADLRMAVIDEQHRFGVHQRLELAAKGAQVDILVMTATPIPRTLMLTAYGDMDGSRLVEKPAGRRPIDTRVLPSSKLSEIAAGVRRKVKAGARVYWVCPLVEDNETLDLAAAEERFKDLSQMFGARVGLVHGRMKGQDKDAVMADFKSGAIDILVATTVIEVGVDVPEATVMVIEHAERFGLAQLHQLRGRVGRGDQASTCLLVYLAPLSKMAQKRLKIMRETEDGFVIAEEDLKLRGAGELLGTRQSGLPELRLADLALHQDLLATATADAKLVLQTDPDLHSPRGQALRCLLYLFERDAAIKLLRSG